MTTAIKMAMGCLAGLLVQGAMAAEPSISGVTVRQRWPWSKLVDIDYVLDCEGTQRLDIAVSGYNASTALGLLPGDSLSGDLYSVSEGTHRITWDPTATSCTNAGVLGKFHVALVPTPPPVYLIIDLTKAAGATNQVEYICPGDSRLETYGRWTNVWFGVTNDTETYKTDKLVLRRVPAGTVSMGQEEWPPKINATLTHDFYAGVFEVTATQWNRIMGAGSLSARPKGTMTYNDLRGATNDSPSINWPATGHSVTPTNFIGRLRGKTGFGGFDLPTEAQWECLCRAGTASYWSDGLSASKAETNIMNELGWWYPGNSAGHSHSVGEKLANCWGIYDTHGNVGEWVLDWVGALTGGIDPEGPTSSLTGRMNRGGGYYSSPEYCRSAYASYYRYNINGGGSAPTAKYDYVGFRLVLNLP